MQALINMIEQITRFSSSHEYVHGLQVGGRFDDINKPEIIKIYTHDYTYTITARNIDDDSYLGCTASIRKPRAGEDWFRGRDLPDGKFNMETWGRIKDAILANELVKVAANSRQDLAPTKCGCSSLCGEVLGG